MKHRIPYGLVITAAVGPRVLVRLADRHRGGGVAGGGGAAALGAGRSPRARNEAAAANAELRELTMLTEMGELLQLSTTLAEANEILPPFALRLFPSYAGALYVAGAASARSRSRHPGARKRT